MHIHDSIHLDQLNKLRMHNYNIICPILCDIYFFDIQIILGRPAANNTIDVNLLDESSEDGHRISRRQV